MILLPYLMLLSAFSIDQLAKSELVPRTMAWIPEILSAMALLLVLLHGAVEKRLMIAGKYIVILGGMGMLLGVSLIVNDVQPGTIFLGLRTYIKFLPFFFMPIVYSYSEAMLGRQIILVMVLGVIQMPMALVQRFILFEGWGTGDVITGTVASSGVLSVVLVCFISVLMAMYLRKRIQVWQLCVLLFIYIIPVGINETKATAVFLPMVLVASFLCMPEKKEQLKSIIAVGMIGGLVLVAFVGIYSSLYSSRGDMRGGSVIGFVTDPEMLKKYLLQGAADSKLVGDLDRPRNPIALSKQEYEGKPRRLDGVMVAWKVLSGDVVRLLVGVGIGNIADSYLGPRFSGKYSFYTVEFGAADTGLSQLLWEFGLLGLIMALAFLGTLLRDSIVLARDESLYGVLAQGWVGIVLVMLITLIYQNNVILNAISYPFWFFSGHVVAARARQMWSQQFRAVTH